MTGHSISEMRDLVRIVIRRIRHEDEEDGEDDGNDPADNGEPEYGDAPTDDVGKLDADSEHELVVGAQRAPDALLADLRRVLRSDDAEGAAADAGDEPADVVHLHLQRRPQSVAVGVEGTVGALTFLALASRAKPTRRGATAVSRVYFLPNKSARNGTGMAANAAPSGIRPAIQDS